MSKSLQVLVVTMRQEDFSLLEKMNIQSDALIGNHAKGWKTSRLSKLSRSVLRLAVYEMLYEAEIPYSVSINEAVELTKKYDDEKAYTFVNGVLNRIKESEAVAAVARA